MHVENLIFLLVFHNASNEYENILLAANIREEYTRTSLVCPIPELVSQLGLAFSTRQSIFKVFLRPLVIFFFL